MSGWIKLEKDRREDPRVIRMARQLRDALASHERFMANASVTLVLGCLDVFWCYADTHIREDDTLDLGVDEIDELVGLKGFCGLMPADWLEVLDANRVKLPDFHAHNGTESKHRALTQKRTERYRHAQASQKNKESSRTSVTTASPDQDQTKTRPRPERVIGTSPPAPRPTKRCPADFAVTPDMLAWAAKETPGVNVDRETAAMRDYEFARPRADWPAVWRNWLRKSSTSNGHAQPVPAVRKTRYEQSREALERATAAD